MPRPRPAVSVLARMASLRASSALDADEASATALLTARRGSDGIPSNGAPGAREASASPSEADPSSLSDAAARHPRTPPSNAATTVPQRAWTSLQGSVSICQRACSRPARPPRRHRERTAMSAQSMDRARQAVLLALAFVTAFHFGAQLLGEKPVAAMTQALLMPLLALWLFMATRAPRSRTAQLALLALGFSWLGDTAPRLVSRDAAFLTMLGFFLVAQVLLVLALLPHREHSVLRGTPTVSRVLLGAALGLCVATLLGFGRHGPLAASVVCYASSIIAMALLATALGRPGSRRRLALHPLRQPDCAEDVRGRGHPRRWVLDHAHLRGRAGLPRRRRRAPGLRKLQASRGSDVRTGNRSDVVVAGGRRGSFLAHQPSMLRPRGRLGLAPKRDPDRRSMLRPSWPAGRRSEARSAPTRSPTGGQAR